MVLFACYSQTDRTLPNARCTSAIASGFHDYDSQVRTRGTCWVTWSTSRRRRAVLSWCWFMRPTWRRWFQ
jgi:hypothetical protein